MSRSVETRSEPWRGGPSERPRITMLLPELRIGGAQRVFVQLLQGFRERGFPVELVLLFKEGELLRDLPEDLPVIALCDHHQPPLISLVRGFWRLRQYLLTQRPECLLSSLPRTNLFAALVLGTLRGATRFYPRESASLDNINRPIHCWLMRILYRKASRVILLTTHMARQYRQQLGLPAALLTTIPNPVAQESLLHAAHEPLPEGAPMDRHYILSVGRLYPQKDYPTLLRAFSIVSKARPELTLVILGEGPERPRLEALTRELGIEGRVDLRGFEVNPYRWMKRAQLYVMSSRWEGYPNALLEAVALGVPCVASRYDSSVEEDLGWAEIHTVPPADSDALASAILSQVQPTPRVITTASLPIPSLDVVIDRYLEVMQLSPGHAKTGETTP